jgi:hypothetical protein
MAHNAAWPPRTHGTAHLSQLWLGRPNHDARPGRESAPRALLAMVVRARGARLGAVITDSLVTETGQGLHREVPHGRAHMPGKGVQAATRKNGAATGRQKLNGAPRHSGKGRQCGG